MSCDRYWREGIVLVEQGLPDLHRETCEDCRRAHAAREELVRALPSLGPATNGDPSWQARVWAQIAREQTPSRRAWFLGGAVVAAVVMIVVIFGWGRWREPAAPKYAFDFKVVKGTGFRGDDARVGDRLRVQLHPTDEIRIYRGAELMFRCGDTVIATGCTHDARGSIGVFELATAGEYTVVLATKPVVEPKGSLDRDLAAIVTAGGKYRIERELSVR
jgi:hypothetical protein